MKELSSEEHIRFLTEQYNPLSEDIDTKSSLDIVEIISREDQRVAKAVYDARASIAAAIDWVAEAFQNGGRLVYAGAGSSGRLGVLDAAECPPTFGVPDDLVQASIAGGPDALTQSVEGAEDNSEAGVRDMKSRSLHSRDVIIGISSGSTAAYVRGALEHARQLGARTILLTSTPLAERGDFADLVITMMTGPEILTGSTRMKAGTATKMALNMISTGAMIRTGRTYGNLMVDLACTNRKLLRRGTRIVQDVTGLTEEKAAELLHQADDYVKTALAMGILEVEKEEAEKVLAEHGGFLRRLLDQRHPKNPRIDAVFFDMDGTLVQYGLPTGFSTWAALGWAFGIFQEMEDWVDKYLGKQIAYDDIWRICAERIRDRDFTEVRDVLFPCVGLPPFNRGVPDCMNVLRGHYRLGIVSSGISIVSEEVRKMLKLDFEVSNYLGTTQGRFDGTYEVRVPFDKKLEVVKTQAEKLGNVPLERICFIGDSPNDIEVLQAVGLPVAYRPKTPAVAEAARGNVIGDFLQLPRLIERFSV